MEIRSKEYQSVFTDLADKQEVKSKTVGNRNGNLERPIGKAVIS